MIPKKIIHSLISFFIIFSFFSILFGANVIALTTYTTGFEDGTVSQQYNVGWMSTSSLTGRFYVDNNYVFFGTKCFCCDHNGTAFGSGTWTYTYTSPNLLLSWSTRIRIQRSFPTDINNCNWTYYDESGIEIIKFRQVVAGGMDEIYYQKHTGGWVLLQTISTNNYHLLGFEFTDNDTVHYYIDTTHTNDTPRNVVDVPQIKTLRWNLSGSGGAGAGEGIHLDNHSVKIGTFEETVTYPTIPSCDNKIGNIYLDSYQLSRGKYLQQIYKNTIACNITRVDLLVHAYMYSNGATSTTFECKINEYNLGFASSFTRIDDYYWLVSWSGLENIEIKGEYIWLAFKSNINWQQAGETRYWAVGVTNNDVDGDGYIRCLSHNDDFYWNNYCNSHNYRELGVSNVFETIDVEFIYRLCITAITEEKIYEYENDIICFPEILNIGDTVYISYTISGTGFGYENYLVVNKSGIEYLNKTLDLQSGGFIFVPYETGQYNATLIQNDVIVASDIFTVTGSLGENYVYTVPSQTKSNELFNIYYKYPYTEYDGKIRIIKGNTVIDSLNISRNSTGVISTSLSTEGLYYIRLYINRNDTLFQINNSIHVVNNGHNSFIAISDKNINVPETITIYGRHNFIGFDVTIMDNNNVIQDVSLTSYFDFYEYVEEVGTHNFTLAVKLGNDIIILDYEILIASGELPIQEEERRGLFYGLPLIFRVGMALALVVFVTFLPYMFLFVLSKGVSVHKEVKVPNIILLGFFIFSISIGIMLGLIEIYVLVIIIFVFVLYFVANYIIGKQKAE